MGGRDIRRTVPVAVIVPCYNYGRFISQLIESVLAQTVKPAELIVVDDGSTDNSRQACQEYDAVRYIWKENGGVSSARNLGLAESSAEYVIFPDADDVLRPEGLKILWEAKQKVGAGVPAVFGRAETFGTGESQVKKSDHVLPNPEDLSGAVLREIPPDIKVLSEKVLATLVRGNIVPQCSAMIARFVYDEIGLWDTQFRYHQDRDIWLRIASRYPVAYVDRTVAGIRRHDENITHAKNWIRNHCEILDLLEKTTRSDWAKPELRRLAKKHYAIGAYNLGQRLAERGSYRQAASLMWRSWARNPLFLKAAIRMTQYALPGLVKGEPDRRVT